MPITGALIPQAYIRQSEILLPVPGSARAFLITGPILSSQFRIFSTRINRI